MNPRYKPLPIPIPSDYANLLGCHPAHLCHVNKGRKRLRDDQCHLLMEAVETDERLAGLTILHLRQDMVQWQPYSCKLCPRDRKKDGKKRARRGQR